MADSLGIEIRAVPVEQIIDLRHCVLRRGLPRESARFAGDDAPSAIHLAAFLDTRVIGCATLHANKYENEPAYQLRGMAVEPAYQRFGVGRLLLIETERRAANAGMTIIWANCRTPAVPFYEKLGWRIVSDEFTIETAGPHFKMMKLMRA